jgi:molybdenum cofactor cytidylyltransferase
MPSGEPAEPFDQSQGRPFISGVILAAGASTRLGQPKQLLLLDSRPLLQHSLEAAAASSLDEIILVLGHRAWEVRAALRVPRHHVRVVVNAQYAQGQSTSLRLGLQAADPQATAAAILLGDQPRVTAQLIDKIAADFLRAGLPAARPVFREPNGRLIPGHPVFLVRPLWSQVQALTGDEGLRALFRAHPGRLMEVTVEGAPPIDIDTWEDYQRAVRASGLSGRPPTEPLSKQDLGG